MLSANIGRKAVLEIVKANFSKIEYGNPVLVKDNSSNPYDFDGYKNFNLFLSEEDFVYFNIDEKLLIIPSHSLYINEQDKQDIFGSESAKIFLGKYKVHVSEENIILENNKVAVYFRLDFVFGKYKIKVPAKITLIYNEHALEKIVEAINKYQNTKEKLKEYENKLDDIMDHLGYLLTSA